MEYLSVANTASTLGISRVTVYHWIKAGKIDSITIRGEEGKVSYAVPVAAVEKYLSSKKASSDGIVEQAIKRTYKEYGNVLEKLADE